MATEFAGYVLRATDRHLTARFYSDLGLVTNEHQHGGPKHYEVGPLADSFVVEVYQASLSFPQDAIMLAVDSISTALEVALRYGILPQGELRDVPNMKFIYIADPDGRPLMLIERQ